MDINLREFWIWLRVNFSALWGIAGLMLVLFLATSFLNQAVDGYSLLGGVSLAALDQGQWWRVLTTIFLHAGAFHFAFNLFALWDIGGVVERYFGSWKFLLTLIVSALGGVFLSLAMRYFRLNFLELGGIGEYVGITIGISGGVFGLAGLLLVTNLRRRSNGVPVNTSALALIILFNLLLGFAISGVDNWGHIGGLLTGSLLGLVLFPKGEERWPALENMLPKLGWLCIISIVLAFVLQLVTFAAWLL